MTPQTVGRHAVIATVAIATVPANLAFDVDWRLAFPAGLAVLAFGEVLPRFFPARPQMPGSRPTGAHPLTPRETEVATLASRPMTSKEIAKRLFIAEHTVDRHLDNTYNKLNISSRVELALWMKDRGLLPDESGRKETDSGEPPAPVAGRTKSPPRP